jgi:hypothetical protein
MRKLILRINDVNKSVNELDLGSNQTQNNTLSGISLVAMLIGFHNKGRLVLSHF